ALIAGRGRWVPPGVVARFAEQLAGFASTISTDFNTLALGRRPKAMARAVNRLLDLHGGIVLVDGERVVWELPLPIGGIMTPRSLRGGAAREDELRRPRAARGFPPPQPLYTLFFLAAPFLPVARPSRRGVWDVKRSQLLLPARPRAGAR